MKRRATWLAIGFLWSTLAAAQQRPQPTLQQFSSAPETCRASIEGNSYYNTTAHQSFTCSGSPLAWTAVENAAAVAATQTSASLYTKKVTLTIAQVILLNSTPITLVAAENGFLVRPDFVVIVRTGARYATAPGSLTTRCVSSSPFAWTTHSGTVLTATSDSNGTYANYGNSGTTGGNASQATADIGGKAIDIFSLTGNPTVDGTNVGSGLIVVVYYRRIPTTTANIDIQ